jgi:hypothetical protein
MARKSSVRYWPNRGVWSDAKGQVHKGGYYCWFNGKQYPLATGPDDYPHGPTYQAAFKAFGDLLRLEQAEYVKDKNTLRLVSELDLEHIASRGTGRPMSRDGGTPAPASWLPPV